tara:strand:- start:870 stop:1262 length:393 start_codon:yes stop_codon:yes gene_type:complete
MDKQILIKDRSQLLLTHLFMYQSLLPKERYLTVSELSTLIEFLNLDSKFEHKRFGSLAKELVADALNTSKVNIGHKVNSLILKKYLWRDEDKVVYINDNLKKFVEEYNATSSSDSFTLHVSNKRRTKTSS